MEMYGIADSFFKVGVNAKRNLQRGVKSGITKFTSG